MSDANAQARFTQSFTRFPCGCGFSRVQIKRKIEECSPQHHAASMAGRHGDKRKTERFCDSAKRIEKRTRNCLR